MKLPNNFINFSFSVVLLVLLLSILPSLVLARSVHDPFMEEFQVGAHSDPDKVELAWGYPAGLLTSAFIDTSWTKAGLEILSQRPASQSPHLCLRLLAAMGDEAAAQSWIKWHRLRIEQLVSWPDSLPFDGGRYLLAERLTMGFFRAIEHGEIKKARQLAQRLASPGSNLNLPGRNQFVWDLRSRLLGKMLKNKEASSPMFWASMMKLGTFDLGNAWGLWTSHRRLNGYPALPKNLRTRDDARRLAILRKSWLVQSDIRNSAFSHDTKAALGSKLLKKNELNQHLNLYPDPPDNFMLQGWWVSGQRSNRRGQTSHYETLGKRSDLKPGWQLDLFRRASEIHLLNGRWQPGLQDLAVALEKAGQNAGTAGQRRRVRQWSEQALVLALAGGDTLTAQKIHVLAQEKLVGDQLKAFLLETRNWSVELGLAESDPTARDLFKDQLRSKVERGDSSPIKPSATSRKQDFSQATSTPLWKLWARWGAALIDDHGNNNLIEYKSTLDKIMEANEPRLQVDLVIHAVSLLLKDQLDKEALLRWVLDKDIHHLSDGRSLTAMSPMSGLAKQKLKDPAALHAMLGIALMADDLRGIVGVATPMVATGLTNREKLCFLYPLPRAGSIHRALSDSENDPGLLLAVARNESLFEPSVRSRAGALGWMQIMPFHFSHKGARPGVNNWSCAAISIAKGDGLLTENRRRYKGNPYLTLAAYNAGPGAVARWQKQLGGNSRNDIFLAWIGYPETRHYVEKVLVDREIYDWIISESRLNY